jgi:UDP-glucose 4-epimerase
VFSSTCATYGTPKTVPITEDDPQVPINPYGVSKLFFERALDAYSQAYGIRHVSLHYFNAAGGDPSGEIGELHAPEPHLVPLACSAAHGEIPHLKIFGADYPTPDGTCIRDYIHVNRVLHGFVHIGAGGEVHDGVATGKCVSKCVCIAQVEDYQRTSKREKIVARTQVVVHSDVVSTFPKTPNCMTADVTRTASNNDLHPVTPWKNTRDILTTYPSLKSWQ